MPLRASAQKDTLLRHCEADEASRSNLGGSARDCHAEFTLSDGEILRLWLRMTKDEDLAMPLDERPGMTNVLINCPKPEYARI